MFIHAHTKLCYWGAAYPHLVSVNKKHWIEKGFSEKFDAIKDNIDELTLHDVDIYGKNSKGEHSNDKGIVATFLKI